MIALGGESVIIYLLKFVLFLKKKEELKMSKEVYLDCKVEKAKDEKKISFDKLDLGEVFVWHNDVLMKVERYEGSDQDLGYAVYLDGSGCLEFINKKELVTRVKSARLYVKV